MLKQKIYIRLFLFIVPLIIAGIIMEITLRKIPNDLTVKKENLLKNRKQIKTLILGGSHAFYGLKPELFDSSTYNMAYVSQSILFDKLILKKFIDSLPNIKNIVIPISFVSLSQKYGDGEESWRKYNYFRYYQIEPSFGQWYNSYYLELTNIPFKKNFAKFYKFLLGGNTLSTNEKGWCTIVGLEKIVDIDKSSKVAAIRHENGSLNFTENVNNLQEIIILGQSKNIKIYFVIFPFWKTYLSNLNANKFEKIISTMTEFQNKNGNVRFYNFSNNINFQTLDYFSDADHLSIKGAEKFSRCLNKIINEN